MKSTSTYYFSIHLLVICFFLSVNPISAQEKVKLTILHTNDTHSQVEPTDKNASKTPDMGGYARRLAAIEQVRADEKNVLLLDAGDYCQGTPYFTFFNGRLEIDAMNRMKYDAATLGNHEFDNGIDSLFSMLNDARFPVLSSNYSFENNTFTQKIKPYIVLKCDGMRIGIMALNVNLDGLVLQRNYAGMLYQDAVEVAQEMSEYLKKKQKCDLIICLSHLGVDPADSQPTDYDVIQATKYIDIIIGGHSHQIVENTTVKNMDGRDVILAQMGKSGLYLGRIDVELQKLRKKNSK